MTPSAVFPEAVALLLDGGAPTGEELRRAVSSALAGAGWGAWRDIEAEIYTYGEKRLVIARPVPPLTARVGPGLPRLRRSADN